MRDLDYLLYLGLQWSDLQADFVYMCGDVGIRRCVVIGLGLLYNRDDEQIRHAGLTDHTVRRIRCLSF